MQYRLDLHFNSDEGNYLGPHTVVLEPIVLTDRTKKKNLYVNK